MRVIVLVNCGAGSVAGGDGREQAAAIEAAFRAAGAEADVREVDPERLGREARRLWDTESPDAIVVAGGDGTVNAVADAVSGTDVVVGVLPLGTFNHFARDLGLPTDLEAAAAALVSAEVRSVDVAEVNGRAFVNNSVLGVYPVMVALRDRIRDERGWGKVRAVPVAAWRVLRTFPTHRLDLEGPGAYRRRRVRTPFVFVGNGVYGNEDGGPVQRGDLVDGRLGVEVARVVSRWGLVRLMTRALVSGADQSRDLDRVELESLTVSSRADRLRVALDGEVLWMRPPLRYRVRPQALRVLAATGAAVEPPVGPSAEPPG